MTSSDKTGEYIVVFMTAPSEEEGARIGRALVDEGLSACCNIIPRVRSIYRWKGKVCDEGEVLCIMKTRRSLFGKLKARAAELHPYDVPEVISIDITDGLPEYLKWIEEETG